MNMFTFMRLEDKFIKWCDENGWKYKKEDESYYFHPGAVLMWFAMVSHLTEDDFKRTLEEL